MENENEWELCVLWHDGKHEKKLSIHKESYYRHTYCSKCERAVLFTRKPPL